MLVTIILGAGAGVLAPHAEGFIKRMLTDALMAETPISDAEMRMLSFALCLLGAALLAWFMGNGGAVALAIGAMLGAFGPRIVARLQGGRD